jgi:hypothetical protein
MNSRGLIFSNFFISEEFWTSGGKGENIRNMKGVKCGKNPLPIDI